MSPLRTPRTFLALAASALALLTIMLFAACDGGDDNDIGPPTDEATPTLEEAIRTPDETSAPDASPTPGVPPTPPSETGDVPIFWRTEDNFASVRAGEPYKIAFRVTSGYDEETLAVVAKPVSGGQEVEFEAGRVEPVGEEAPGTFYHLLLELPDPGTWQVTVMAGDDEVTIPVEVGPPDSPAG